MINLSSKELYILGAISPSIKEINSLVEDSYKTVSSKSWYWTRTIDPLQHTAIGISGISGGITLKDVPYKTQFKGGVRPLLVVEDFLDDYNISAGDLVNINDVLFVCINNHLLLYTDIIGKTDLFEDINSDLDYKDSLAQKMIDEWFKENFE